MRVVSKNGKVYYRANTSKRNDYSGVDTFESLSDIGQRLNKTFTVLDHVVKQAIDGRVKSVIVYGAPGVGKSYGVEKALRDRLCNYQFLSGYVTKVGLIKTLYKFRHSGDVVIFDDCDSVLYDESSLALLKAICDTTDNRAVTYLSNISVQAEEPDVGPIPRTFEFNGTVMFITNTDFRKVDGKLAAHTEAMLSRSVYIDIGINCRRDALVRINQVLDQNNILGRYSEQVQRDVRKYINENYENVRELSLRTVIKIAQLRDGDAVNWQEMADVTELRR